ncbi:hypothetical protein HYH39_16085 [Clostridium botulinum]|uniref:hypothetical protein n=1 Tax=unclassified Clostridium TaxID=2614128 RepID=UPI0005007A6A|nr:MULTISPECIES: hypothetical protein [unclassified Clostridium]KFX54710.1 hypothetical protein KU40_13615 [Clostridium botulinum]MBY6780423.1 hypothetical protein [Clostridium botulinum]MBY6853628.1 hypothetical protein [Clostridium botulinum]MBY7009200.1 hypothetical protein [Clostridium botulinum]
MKRIYAIILVLVLSLGLISCTDKKVSSNNIKEDNEVSSESDNESNSANEKNTDKLNENKNDVKEASSNSDTAKNSTSNNSSSSNNNTVSNSNNSTSTKTDSQNVTKEVSNDKNEEQFYGNWVIKEVVGYSKVSGGSDPSSVINTKMSFSGDSATFGETSWKNPQYIIKSEKKDDLEYDYRTNFSKLGINKDSIVNVRVEGEKPNFQRNFFIKDDNTLIYCDEGVFYDVERISSTDKNK